MSEKNEFKDEASKIAKDDLLGVSEWKRSKLSWLTGAGTFVNAAKSPINTIKDGGKGIADLGKKVFGQERVKPLPTDSVDPAERFKVAQRMNKVAPSDLQEIQEKTHKMFLTYLLLIFFIVGIGILTFGNSAFSLPVDLAIRLALVPVLLALAVKQSFYNWQIRTKRLGSLSEWWHNPAEWWTSPPAGKVNSSLMQPRRTTGNKTLKTFAFVLLCGGSLTFLSHPANAQSTASFFQKPGPDDLWMQLLTKVFPGVGPLGTGNGNQVAADAIASAFGSFLACLMAFAAIYMAWGIVYGLVSTAHEGKVMGERWHQVWAPVRVILGVGILTPIVKGYCLAQIMVIWLAVWGGSIGNVLWSAYVGTLGAPSVTSASLPQTLDLTRDVLKIETCWSTVSAMEASTSGFGLFRTYYVPQTRPDLNKAPSFTTPDIASAALGWNEWGAMGSGFTGPSPTDKLHYTWDYGSCGQINLDVSSAANSYDQQMLNNFKIYMGSIRTAADKIAATVKPGANSSASDIPNAITDALSARATLDSSLFTAAQQNMPTSSSTAMTNFIAEANKGGWVTAGSYYMTLNRIQSQWMAAVNNLPAVSFGDPQGIKNADIVQKLVGGSSGGTSSGSGLMGQLDTLWAAQSGSSSNSTVTASAAQAGAPTDTSSFQAALNWAWLKSGATKYIIDAFSASSTSGSALGHMMNLGYSILNIFWAVMAIGILVKGVSGSVAGGIANAFGGSGVLAGVGSFLTMVAIGLFAAGVVHAYVLPMIPYVIFLFFIMGMLVLVTEGVIAACLFALFHVSLSGRELFEREQMAGYMIMFNILTRIPLAMLGLFLSLAVFEAMVWLMSFTFYPAVLAAMGTSGAGFVGLVVMVIIMTYLHYQLAIRSFSLITQVPDRVQRWFAGQGEGMGEDEHTRGHSGFIVGEVRSSSQSIVNSGILAGGRAAPASISKVGSATRSLGAPPPVD